MEHISFEEDHKGDFFCIRKHDDKWRDYRKSFRLYKLHHARKDDQGIVFERNDDYLLQHIPLHIDNNYHYHSKRV